MFSYVKALVTHVLLHPFDLEWTAQGFGMIRCYPDGDEVRLNIWHRAFLVPGVSTIHNHPWNLESLCVGGRLFNQRFIKDAPLGVRYQHVLLKPGKAVLLSEINQVRLEAKFIEIYNPGESYVQVASEVHETKYVDGTVTINKRTERGPDVADVYWLEGPWGSAKPRAATEQEIVLATSSAMELIRG